MAIHPINILRSLINNFESNPFTLGWKKNFKRVFSGVKYPSRINNQFSNLEILQEYGEIIYTKERLQDIEERDEGYKENNSEIVDHQDINETIIDHLPPLLHGKSRAQDKLLANARKMNDTNFETIGVSRDNLSPLDGIPEIPLNGMTHKDCMEAEMPKKGKIVRRKY